MKNKEIEEIEKENPIQGNTQEDNFIFNISSDIDSQREAPFEAGIKKAVLKTVLLIDTEIKKGENKGTFTKVLNLKFQSLDDSQRYFTHKIFTPTFPNKNTLPKDLEAVKKNLETLSSNIKHIIEAYIPYTEEISKKYFSNISSGINLLENFQSCLQNEGINETPIYTNIPVYLKISYTKNGGNNLSFPYRYPFIEKIRVVNNIPLTSTLTINPEYDLLSPNTAKKASEETRFFSPEDPNKDKEVTW